MRQARSTLAQTESTIPPLAAGRRQAANQLCTLLAIPVSDLASQLAAAPIPDAPPAIAIGIPADLVRRRPDVRRAERQVAAQSAQIGVAEADLYPTIFVGGTIGVESESLSKLFEGRSFSGTIMPNFRWNVLNYGRILNNVRR